ncbi:NAD(P)/FAD-dependent oxidoreductase [Nostocoides sp. F2B08]|uniref:dihydrolipoyl dehydrogenase family protein n=1 Tax=Nostocoides sp. F2B08 TaxID=2653936 RepID=UPI001262FC11|nr:NAD(P)/FAD-dependent oxidoreductase [Tetrasphaera sp. F2B08]KAB7745601.1 NAD(P)/FAD-dependent oxidoreductase [Tetrasphaera sp. F2B08]
MQTFDVAVIGLGPGGEHVANTLAERGLSVLGIEHRLVGGECPYWGCIPTKMMVRAAYSLAEARRVDGLAGHVSGVTPDWSTVAARIREEATDSWDDTVAVERFTGKGGTFARGEGRIVSPTEVAVGDTRYAVRTGIVVATGSTAAIPPVPGLSEVDYWTNRQAVETAELPQSIVVLGGGAIGCELGQVFARFGVDVTIIEGAPRLLSAEEPEAGDLVVEVLRRDGITVHTGVRAERVSSDGAGITVHLDDGSAVTGDRLLVSTGRRADPAAVGLTAVGVDQNARVAPVDERCRVAPGVWAVGDVTGEGAFTHIAMYQAGIVIRDILGEDGPPASYAALPRVTFTDPEVGAVGLTEATARERYANVRVGCTPLSGASRAWIHAKGNDGLIKIIEDADRGVLVGATTMGPAGGEIMGALAVAVHAEVPVEKLRSMILAFPTFHRGIGVALEDLG